MLLQNWFCADNMIMFEEYIGGQMFFDTNTNCIYNVYEDEYDFITIKQIEPNNQYYNMYYADYVNFINKQ